MEAECPECGWSKEVPERARGKKGECPECGQEFEIKDVVLPSISEMEEVLEDQEIPEQATQAQDETPIQLSDAYKDFVADFEKLAEKVRLRIKEQDHVIEAGGTKSYDRIKYNRMVRKLIENYSGIIAKLMGVWQDEWCHKDFEDWQKDDIKDFMPIYKRAVNSLLRKRKKVANATPPSDWAALHQNMITLFDLTLEDFVTKPCQQMCEPLQYEGKVVDKEVWRIRVEARWQDHVDKIKENLQDIEATEESGIKTNQDGCLLALLLGAVSPLLIQN